jgi:uncharacterized protein
MYYFLATAFLLGLTSTLHCLGMCGPISLALPLNRTNNWTILSDILQYHFGRIFTYAILGFIVGTIGFTIKIVSILQWLSIISGIIILIFAWKEYFTLQVKLKFDFFQVFFSRSMGKLMKTKTPFQLVLLGGLNGLLPCGMVYFALLGSLVVAEPLQSATYMLVFGIGTLPSLIIVSFSANYFSQKLRKMFTQITPFLLTLIALMMILRGLNLNIPYLSPKVESLKNGKDLKFEECHEPTKK